MQVRIQNEILAGPGLRTMRSTPLAARKLQSATSPPVESVLPLFRPP